MDMDMDMDMVGTHSNSRNLVAREI